MTREFENKVVAITGAGRGLGRAYAHYFAERGASIVVNNRSYEDEPESSADRVVGEIVAAGGSAVADYNSVEDSGAGDRILAAGLENFGRLDVLIANAGVDENKLFRNLTLSELRQNLEINLVGTLNVTHPAFQYMCNRQNGSIVVTASSAGLFGLMGMPAYSASKAALIGLMHSLSLEGESLNVSVNAIAPYAATKMTDAFVSDEVLELLAPENVASVVGWLASGAVTGELLIAGGTGVARAKMKTTAPIQVSEFGSRDWQRLSSAALDLEFDNGRENFEHFVAALSNDG